MRRTATVAALASIWIMAVSGPYAQTPSSQPSYKTFEISFRADDSQELFGKLTMPDGQARRPVVVMIQTAEAQTMDSRIQGPRGPIDFFDLYRRELAGIGVAFFSYEGRGVRTGTQPPRYVSIDRAVFNAATLDRKVADAVAAVRALRARADIDASQVWLTGVSEGTLLATETAARIPSEVRGLVLSSVVADMRESIKFMMTGGGFLQHQSFWDANHDGKITPDEFAADPRRIRRAMPGVELSAFDANKDGVYTVDDRRLMAKSALDAVDAGNLEIVGAWLKATSVLEVPEGWLKDHFAHSSIWTYLSRLDMPVGVFHGEIDGNTPVDGVRGLERQAAVSGKAKMEFHYFADEDHSLGGLDYFMRGAPSEGYKELFAYVKRQVSH